MINRNVTITIKNGIAEAYTAFYNEDENDYYVYPLKLEFECAGMSEKDINARVFAYLFNEVRDLFDEILFYNEMNFEYR